MGVSHAHYGRAMRADKAVESLEGLKEEASTREVIQGGEHLTAWKGKVALRTCGGGGDDTPGAVMR